MDVPTDGSGPEGIAILVVDDEADSARVLALMLGMGGHAVRVAGDGPGALEAARVSVPALVFLDIGLPGMDGHEVAARMRLLPGLDAAVLVALTGFCGDDEQQRALDAGFDHYLVKPVDPDQLHRLAREVAASA